MTRSIFLTSLLVIIFSSSCKKEVDTYHHSHDWHYYPTYTYYFVQGTVTDSLQNPISGVSLNMEGPCYPFATSNGNGYYCLRTCEMTGKWSYQFGETVPMQICDTATNDVLKIVEIPSSLFLINDTIKVNIDL
ncbi:MAG: hypothetical protein Crog4KO_08310 [Crocinitomicaceae bacterium]